MYAVHILETFIKKFVHFNFIKYTNFNIFYKLF